MVKFSTCIIFFIIGILQAQAQLEKEDSLRLKRMLEGKEEIIINEEAVKSIQFDFLPKEEILQPLENEEKSWMKFNTELPKDFIKKKTDTLQIKFDLKFEVPYSSNAIASFDADKLLFENFTKRGRAIRHNRKHANAWKTYNDYQPTHEDSLKWIGNKKRIPKDTLAIVTDSLR